MSGVEKISLDDLLEKVYGRPALVIGPDLVSAKSVESLLATKLVTQFGLEDVADDLLRVTDDIYDLYPDRQDEVRCQMTEFLNQTVTDLTPLRMLCKPNWCGVVSLSLDMAFFKLLEAHAQTSIVSHPVTVVAKKLRYIRSKTLPYFALMGHLAFETDDEKVVLSQSEYTVRKRNWSSILESLPDPLKADPVFLLGCGSVPERACDFLDELLRASSKSPTRLVVLAGDPLLTNPTFKRIIPKGTELLEVTTSIEVLTSSLANGTASAYQLPLFNKRYGSSRLINADLESIADLAAIVPRLGDLRLKDADRNQLLDALFRPSYPDWRPFAKDMAFRRGAVAEIASAVDAAVSRTDGGSRIIRVLGEAGVGKTITVKMAVFDLAARYDLVVWVRSAAQTFDEKRVIEAFRSLVRIVNDKAKNVIVAIDDPVALGISSREVEHIEEIFATCSKPWSLVLSSRNSDKLKMRNEFDELVEGNEALRTIEIANDFTTDEADRLPQYLFTQGFARSVSEARELISHTENRSARDVLSSLWFCLPLTRRVIQNSLEDEFYRLGDPTVSIENLVYASKAKIAQEAYKLVAVASHLNNLAVPMEVLVSALRVNYGAWVEHCYSNGRPIWGLIYEDELKGSEVVCYRTRNYLVSEILCGILNRNRVGRAGELDMLKKLVAACDSSAPVYRDFLISLLIERRKALDVFALEDRLLLFDIALASHPRKLGLLEHHRALILTKIEGQAGEAYKVLQRLIRESTDKPDDGHDSPQNYHVSAAANLNYRIELGEIDPKEGLEQISKHVSHALLLNQFGIHAYHAHGNSLLTLSRKLQSIDVQASRKARVFACRVADKGIWLMKNQRSSRGESEESMNLLRSLKLEILGSIGDLSNAKNEAQRLFEREQDQGLFVLVARQLLSIVLDAPAKGADFRALREYIDQVVKTVEVAGCLPDDDLRWCRLESVAGWQFAKGRGPVDWKLFDADLLALLGKKENKDEVRLNFWLAVSLFNQKELSEAEHRFVWLRRIAGRWASQRRILAYYTGFGSWPLPQQGTISIGHEGRRYITSSQLKIDMPTLGFETSGDDAIEHFVVGFTPFGPVGLPNSMLPR